MVVNYPILTFIEIVLLNILLIVVQLGREYFRSRVGAAVFKDGSPISLQYSMFIPTLDGQANEEQKKHWLKRAINSEIIGTYAQVSNFIQTIMKTTIIKTM